MPGLAFLCVLVHDAQDNSSRNVIELVILSLFCANLTLGDVSASLGCVLSGGWVLAQFFFWALLTVLLAQQHAPSSPKPPALDFEFFKAKVQPIFLKKRPGHARCIACHAGSQASGFQLQPLDRGSSTWNDEESRKNFEAVKQVVIPGDLRSPLLVHPLAESAGGDFFHSGGKHFMSQDDPEWQTLKAWVFGQTASASR
jgi:hypothetical protein